MDSNGGGLGNDDVRLGGDAGKEKIVLTGNTVTFNLPEAVVTAVKNSPYFRQLYELKTFNHVVDEIYNEVSYVEPWVAGKGLGTASSAFCLLYKMFLMKLSGRQMKVLLTHQDSPYIRALGFLYLRFGSDPRNLWSWMAEYVKDEEQFVPRSNPNARPITMGRYVRDLLRNNKYYDATLPRIPITTMRHIEQELASFAHEDKQERGPRSRSPPTKRPATTRTRKRRSSRSRSPSPARGFRRYSRSPGRRRGKVRSLSWDRDPDRDRYAERRRTGGGHRGRYSPPRQRDGGRDRSPNRRRGDGGRDRSPRRRHDSPPPPSPSRTQERAPSPMSREQAQRMAAVRAKYGAATGSVSLGSAPRSKGTTGIVERDVVLSTQVPKAILKYQNRQAQ